MRRITIGICIACLLICLCAFSFAVVQIWQQMDEQNKAEDQNRALRDQAVSITGSVSEEPVLPEEEPLCPASQPETVSPPQPPIQVDFDKLLASHRDIVAWIWCADTEISYPVVQSGDNEYYLRRLLDGTYNRSGTIFADYRNSPDFSDWNTLIYGHNMKNATMFGTLPQYREPEYYEAHPEWWLLTPGQDYRIELVAGYTTRSDAVVYSLTQTWEERDILLAAAKKLSDFQADVEIGPEDKLVTLSTCTYEQENGRYVLIGVLRPVEKE